VVEDEDIVLLKLPDKDEENPVAPNVLQPTPEYQLGLYAVDSLSILVRMSENFSAH
jgi:hypothetical protein